MKTTDPIADMLTRIRNANKAKHKTVDIPASNTKKSIAKILIDNGYVKKLEYVEGYSQGIIRMTLKYRDNKKKVLINLRRISKPGLRVYSPREKLPRVLNGFGIAVISTSKGIMTDKEARKQNLGGEVLAYIW